MSDLEPQVPDKCPRCGAPTQTCALTPPDEGTAYGCTRCPWPNPEMTRVMTTLARKNTVNGQLLSDAALEDFVAQLKGQTTLKDPKGRVVQAKVAEVHIHDGQVDVVFEFDPEKWQDPLPKQPISMGCRVEEAR